MPSNVFVFPTFGKAITLDDQGVYYTMNTSTGSILSVVQLVYKDDWYLYQLQNGAKEGELCWTIMAENTDYSLNSMTTEEIRRNFAKPEYAEPVGAWQVIKNSKFGFGKFTPLSHEDPISYAMILFSDNDMRAPLLIHKADESLQMLGDVPLQAEEAFA
jgi:hypothetical protein